MTSSTSLSTSLSASLSTPLSTTAALRARNRRVEHYRALVRPIALHYHRRCPEPLEDLIQVGLMGLLRAAELYQSSMATPFEAFARPHIRGAMLHYLRDVALPIRLPRRLDEQRQQLARLRAHWLSTHHRPATEAELRLQLGLEPAGWERLRAADHLVRVVSLDGLLAMGGGDEGEPAATEDGTAHPLDQSRGETAADAVEAGEGGLTPAALLALLEEPLRLVVEKVILAGWSYRRTATALRISPMTVQRRLRKGLSLLRDALLVNPELPRRRAASAAPGC